jgi:hypothetical protein
METDNQYGFLMVLYHVAVATQTFLSVILYYLGSSLKSQLFQLICYIVSYILSNLHLEYLIF